MVRNYYNRKKPPIDADKIKSAVLAVNKSSMKISTASKIFDLPRTLRRWLKWTTDEQIEKNEVIGEHKARNTIFKTAEEVTSAKYLTHCNDMYFGLSAKEFRFLAYDFSGKLQLTVPPSWEAVNMAGEEWLKSFLKRHPNFSIRKPEPTSLARATSFNRTNVSVFFENLKNVLDRRRLWPFTIWNMDETGGTTVHRPDKVIARRRLK